MGLTFDVVGPYEVVPEYECREACTFANYNWSEWVELDWLERATVVAHHRVHNLIESHVNDAVEEQRKRQERAAARSGRRGRGG